MFNKCAFRSRILAGGLIVAFMILLTPVASSAQTPTPSLIKQGTLHGVVYSEGMKSRVANAIVKLRNLNNQKEYSSPP
ncbi:MAG: hypothetical protein ACXWF4_04865, partial [Candidatus Aminicenantales bacterium]